MALPPHHPFWLALAVTLVIAALSALLVYARADRIVSASTAAAFDGKRLRRTASSGVAGSALLFGAAASGFFLALEPRFPDLATDLYRIASSVAAVVLSLAAVRLRRSSRMRGVPELVALNVLWATGFGWLMPAIAGPGGTDPARDEPVEFTGCHECSGGDARGCEPQPGGALRQFLRWRALCARLFRGSKCPRRPGPVQLNRRQSAGNRRRQSNGTASALAAVLGGIMNIQQSHNESAPDDKILVVAETDSATESCMAIGRDEREEAVAVFQQAGEASNEFARRAAGRIDRLQNAQFRPRRAIFALHSRFADSERHELLGLVEALNLSLAGSPINIRACSERGSTWGQERSRPRSASASLRGRLTARGAS